ncbi:MAG: 2-succinyl-5-enolpyruvyl-6-hydroxy-3-cyclohexene-1-carboxylic-acid synthase [Chloroflexi bacterium]|nr:2-succinyl-5-enolpyruvyl-6-hydroxy-3-cyclohexene-1-carboxylic-acid synthase [Chloroflexota bacterium]
MPQQPTSNLRSPISNNPNIHYAWLFVDALAQAGLTAVVISPGSRSTPLTLAFDAHPDIEVFLHLDERSAGFMALGMALELDRPVALVCTSGTAAANYLPAIVEANMSQIPLLILTADRPPELRHSGANQTIDQIKIYGDQVLWSVDAPLPQADAPSVSIRNIQTLAARAYATANGLRKGPVHVNFPFRKPLEPEIRDWRLEIDAQRQISNLQSPISHVSHGRLHPIPQQLAQLTAVIQKHTRGLIICGPRCPGGDFPQAAAALSRQTGYPVLADPISGLRFGEWVADTAVISAYETFLQTDPGWPEPEIILRFGAVPVSKWLNTWLDHTRPAHRIHIRENGVWADDSHRTTLFLQANETAVCQQLTARLSLRENKEWVTAVSQTDAQTWQLLDNALEQAWFDGAVVADALALIPPDSSLFMGNSLPIRHLDQYGRAQTKPIRAYANRGASGIDGNLSTALGMALANGRPLTVILGDITFYHDMNGLLPISNPSTSSGRILQSPISILVSNNNGGGIFNRLPIAQIEPPFTRLFRTPHNLNFAPAAEMYGLAYEWVNGRDHLRQLLSNAPTRPRLLEIRTDSNLDEQRRREINQHIISKINRD